VQQVHVDRCEASRDRCGQGAAGRSVLVYFVMLSVTIQNVNSASERERERQTERETYREREREIEREREGERGREREKERASIRSQKQAAGPIRWFFTWTRDILAHCAIRIRIMFLKCRLQFISC
jgi:hypothetical protein